MTKPNSTFIAVVMDESSSMSSAREATINGLNEFLEQQKKLDGECKVTLQKFSSNVPLAVFMDKDIHQVKRITREDYVPSGMTALYDAIGYTIESLGKRLAMMDEADRPSQVIVVVQTDGEENSSRNYKLEQIRAMIEHQQKVYNWDFVFLGVGLEAFSAGGAMGFMASKTLAYDTNHMNESLGAVSNYVSSARLYGTKSAAFTDTDRSASVGGKTPIKGA